MNTTKTWLASDTDRYEYRMSIPAVRSCTPSRAAELLRAGAMVERLLGPQAMEAVERYASKKRALVL